MKIEYPPLPASEEEEYELDIAERVQQELIDIASGPRDHPATWLVAASILGCRVAPYFAPWGCPGEYACTRRGTGVITYNVACTPFVQARALVHELAHHLIGVLGFAYYVGRRVLYYADMDHMPHRVARRVERLVLGC